MSYIMTADQFVNKAKDIAKNYKTLYVMCAFGACTNHPNTKGRYIKADDYNQKTERKQKINAAGKNVFFFDCVGLIKGILWGWKGDTSALKNYGGAKYPTKFTKDDVPDTNAGGMFNKCTDRSSDFKNILPGEALRCDGHIGIYIGDGLAVESTPSWKDGVQITAVENIAKSLVYPNRKWLAHGKLPWIKYNTVYRVSAKENVLCEFKTEKEAKDFVASIKITEV